MLHCKEYADTVYKIIGAAMEVHSQLGGGLLESVYQEALQLELKDKGIDSDSEKEIEVYYKKRLLKKKFKMDLVIEGIIVELKAVSSLQSEHRAQLCNYLRLTHKPIGILINFGLNGLKGERWAYDEEANECILVDKRMNPVPKTTGILS